MPPPLLRGTPPGATATRAFAVIRGSHSHPCRGAARIAAIGPASSRNSFSSTAGRPHGDPAAFIYPSSGTTRRTRAIKPRDTAATLSIEAAGNPRQRPLQLYQGFDRQHREYSTVIKKPGSMYTTSFAFFEALWDAGVTHCFVNLGSDHPSIIEAMVKGAREKPDSFPRIITCPNEVLTHRLLVEKIANRFDRWLPCPWPTATHV